MYLKIKFANKTKKVLFKEELKTHESFVSFLEKLTSLNRRDFELTFIDHEEETLSINDQFDLDYFVTENSKSNFLTVNIISDAFQESLSGPVQLKESWMFDGQSKTDMNPQPTEPSASTPVPVQYLFTLAKPTSEMNIQTEKVATKEQFIETRPTEVKNSSEQTSLPESVQIQLECKKTQTQIPAQPSPCLLLNLEDHCINASQIDRSLFDRIEALERSVFEKSQNKPEESSISTKQAQIESVPVKTKVEIKTVHLGVTCDSCHKNSFVGKRFKCLVCLDYDLCEECEDQNLHLHPMIRCSVQENSFFLDKTQRRFCKVAKRTCGRFSELGRFARVCGNTFWDRKPEETEIAKVDVSAPVKVVEEYKDVNRNEKKDMLRFMMPFEEERWDDILLKYSQMSLIEFCEVVSRSE